MKKIFLSVIILYFISANIFSQNRKAITWNGDAILAKVVDKVITIDEFIHRAEYTIRPQYCKGDGGIEKKIILNSLIAEKLLALEANDTSSFSRDKYFNDFIRGRQEQVMRQLLYQEEGLSKVKLDPNEVKKIFNLSGRKYKIDYFTVLNDSTIPFINASFKNGKSFSQLYKSLSNSDSLPSREVEYFASENEIIQEALYSDSLKKDKVLGPLKISDSLSIVIKINGWTDRIPITENDIRNRIEDVKEKLSNEKAASLYAAFILNVMNGKKIEFDKSTFPALTKIAEQVYYISKKEKEKSFLDFSFNKESGNEISLLATLENIESIYNHPAFTFERKTWNVQELENEIRIHPLVFREKHFNKNQFAKQFKLAVVDLLRDKCLTDIAYKRGYDKTEPARKSKEMWKDASIALYQKYLFLKNINTKDSSWLEAIEKYLNPYIDSLQQKYCSVIKINVDQLNTISLTHTELIVLQSNVPFPLYVPSFPLLTTDNKLNYGQKLDYGKIKVSGKEEPVRN